MPDSESKTEPDLKPEPEPEPETEGCLQLCAHFTPSSTTPPINRARPRARSPFTAPSTAGTVSSVPQDDLADEGEDEVVSPEMSDESEVEEEDASNVDVEDLALAQSARSSGKDVPDVKCLPPLEVALAQVYQDASIAASATTFRGVNDAARTSIGQDILTRVRWESLQLNSQIAIVQKRLQCQAEPIRTQR